MSLERYRSIIPDWEALQETLGHPEPLTIRVREARIDPDSLSDRLRRQGFEVVPDPFVPGFLRVDGSPYPLSETLEHWMGFFYIQQSVTGVAAPLLAPRPGERVLDLCAAPGGKTSHLASLMNDRGCLVAVEPVEARMHALVGNMARMAHPSTILLGGDARALPEVALFDRVLADVPCSGEGRLRRGPGDAGEPGAARIRRLAELQTQLLRKAVRLVRPGGRVLYVTCTLAPEENEAVVDRILGEAGVRLIPLEPGFPHDPGITAFEGERYSDALAGACRVLPHHLDSGGLFLALLERDPGSGGNGRSAGGEVDADEGWSPSTHSLPGDSVRPDDAVRRIEDAVRILTDEVGVPEDVVESWGWSVRGDDVRVHGMDEWPLEAWDDARGLRVVSVGLRALSPARKGRIRPSTDLLRWMGPTLSGETLDLTELEWLRLLSGAEVLCPDRRDGFAALALEGTALARGHVRKGRLFHDLSTGRAGWLRAVLERRRPVAES